MTYTGQDDGQMVFDAGPLTVSFGPEPHQAMHLVTAERMLAGLAERNPKLFRELYGAAVLGDK